MNPADQRYPFAARYRGNAMRKIGGKDDNDALLAQRVPVGMKGNNDRTSISGDRP